MSSAVSSEEDLLPFLVGVKEEDKLTWEEFGNGTLEMITALCTNDWKLSNAKTIKVQDIWQRHPKRSTLAQQQGK